jgi:hypothetical protein
MDQRSAPHPMLSGSTHLRPERVTKQDTEVLGRRQQTCKLQDLRSREPDRPGFVSVWVRAQARRRRPDALTSRSPCQRPMPSAKTPALLLSRSTRRMQKRGTVKRADRRSSEMKQR